MTIRWVWLAGAALALIATAVVAASLLPGECYDPAAGDEGYCSTVTPATVLRLSAVGLVGVAGAVLCVVRAVRRR